MEDLYLQVNNSLERALKQTDSYLLQRYQLILAVINYPTVYVEMQSFLQCFFKATINGDYQKYGIDCQLKNARLSKYIYSERFVAFISHKYDFSAFDTIDDLNYIANRHKHDETVKYDKTQVELFFKIIYVLTKKYCEEKQICNIDSYSASYFNEICNSNDINRLNRNIDAITKELENTKLSLVAIKNDQELEAAKKNIRELEAIVKKQKEESEKLKKEVKELSNQVKYSDNNMFAFKIDSTIAASDLVELKRRGQFKESLLGYISLLEKCGYAYNYNNFWGMFKVALLAKEFALAKALLFSIFHYEFNYFVNTMNNKDSKEQIMLMMQIKEFMAQNRQFEQLFLEGLETKEIPSIAAISVYSINLMNAYLNLLLAESSYNSQLDNFGDKNEEIMAYFEEIQLGKNSTQNRQYISNDNYRKLTKTSLPLSLIMIMFGDDEFSFEFDNLAVCEIYKIKNRVENAKRRIMIKHA